METATKPRNSVANCRAAEQTAAASAAVRQGEPVGARTAVVRVRAGAGRAEEGSEAAEHGACDARQALRRVRSNPERCNCGAGMLHTPLHAPLHSTMLHSTRHSIHRHSTSTPHLHSILHSTPVTMPV